MYLLPIFELTFKLKIAAEELMAGIAGVSAPPSAAEAVLGRGLMLNV